MLFLLLKSCGLLLEEQFFIVRDILLIVKIIENQQVLCITRNNFMLGNDASLYLVPCGTYMYQINPSIIVTFCILLLYII